MSALLRPLRSTNTCPSPFERTAVNGYGFIQIVRRRERASLIELLRADPVRSASMAAMRDARAGRGRARLS